jgi:hypothetical protein
VSIYIFITPAANLAKGREGGCFPKTIAPLLTNAVVNFIVLFCIFLSDYLRQFVLCLYLIKMFPDVRVDG